MAQSSDEFQAFLDRLKDLPDPKVSDSLKDFGPAWKQAILDGTSGDTGGNQQSPMAVDIPPVNSPARLPSWEQAAADQELAKEPSSAPEATGGAMPAELGQALVGATAPAAAQASGPSRNIIGPDTPINGSGPQAAPSAPSGENPMDAISKLFDPKALAVAQEQARQSRMGTGIFQALAQGAGTMTRTPVNEQFWKGLNEDANAPVSNLEGQQAQQARKMQAFNSALDLGLKTDANNPNSPFAKVAQQIAGQLATGAGLKIDPATLSKMSPKQLDDLQKELTNIYDVKTKAEANRISKMALMNQKQSQSRSDLFGKAEQTKQRGSVKNAWDALRLTDNIQSLLDEYPDLNQMPDAQVKLLTAEMAKVAGGGAATEAGQKDLRPESYRSELQEGLAKLTNSPTASHLGEFLNTYKPYVGSLRQNAQNRIGESLHALKTGYKGRVSDQDLQDFNDEYKPYLLNYDNFRTHQAGQNAGNSQQGYSSDVMNYAQTHGITPDQANQIKISRTGGH